MDELWTHDGRSDDKGIAFRVLNSLTTRGSNPEAGKEGGEMDSDYVFLCGVMWCRFGQQDAGEELLRAATSVDPDMRALACAMLARGCPSLEGFGKTDKP